VQLVLGTTVVVPEPDPELDAAEQVPLVDNVYEVEQAVHTDDEEQVAQLVEQATHDESDKTNYVIHAVATVALVQVETPFPQLAHAYPFKKYPLMHEVETDGEEQEIALLSKHLVQAPLLAKYPVIQLVA